MMANHILILTSVMLLAGIFGGLVNYYMYNVRDPDATSLPRCVVVGVGAAFLVPVILDLLNSDLVLESQGDPSRLLIFTGFCLISAIISRFFVSNISDRILSEANEARKQSESVQHDLKLIKNEIMPLIDTETEYETSAEANDIIADQLDALSAQVLKILSSGRFIYRTLSGLCKEINADESTMQRTLQLLVGRDLAGKVSGQNGPRWHITEKGRRLVESQV